MTLLATNNFFPGCQISLDGNGDNSVKKKNKKPKKTMPTNSSCILKHPKLGVVGVRHPISLFFCMYGPDFYVTRDNEQ